MEIIIGIVVVLAILFWLGGLDNNRPVKDWSDDKLMRMHPKLLAARQYEKASEVKEEIERRMQQHKANAIAESIPLPDMQMMQAMAENSVKLMRRTMQEHSCSEDQARAIVGQKIDDLEKKFLAEGCDKDTATEKALKELGLVN